jgi:hypothetical protein
VHCGNGFDAQFEPYQRACLSRYNAALSLGAICGDVSSLAFSAATATAWPLAARAEQGERVRHLLATADEVIE